MDSFLLSSTHEAFHLDEQLSSHPIVQTVSNPDEITSIFDVISYRKVLLSFSKHSRENLLENENVCRARRFYACWTIFSDRMSSTPEYRPT